MKKFLPLVLVAIVSSCCSVKTVSVNLTEPRPAIPVKNVQLALSAPTNAVLIANIFAYAQDSADGAEVAQSNLKIKAASVGANLLVIERSNQNIEFDDPDNRFSLEANAYFVP
jgi:hypothetical protein